MQGAAEQYPHSLCDGYGELAFPGLIVFSPRVFAAPCFSGTSGRVAGRHLLRKQ
jgi:hypothetical protein